MRRKTVHVMAVLALVVAGMPSVALAIHEVTDERLPTPLEEFREDVGSWIGPWLSISTTHIADDHAPWLAVALYEELLGIKPEPCYYDTYAAHWAVAAGLRALGQAPTQAQMEAELGRVIEDIARADARAELSAVHGLTGRTDTADIVEVEPTPYPGQDPNEATDALRVIEIEATAALQFTDGSGNRLEEIAVTPGETVVFRVRNTADFEHSFYIGTDQELEVPEGKTHAGIEAWPTGVRELEWTVPDDVSDLMFGCTVPGHFPLMHGTFAVASPGEDTSLD